VTYSHVVVHHPVPEDLEALLVALEYVPIETDEMVTTFVQRKVERARKEATVTPINPTMDSGVEFISLPEWCRRMGCSLDAGYRAARRSQIPGLFRIGRLMRINWKAFVASAQLSRQ
jgi:hypothetical protein